jgi:endonuclease/exonuclease/phosphatase family metal-dependent hydrolase
LVLIASLASADEQAVRIATWNLETIGAPDSAQYQAAQAVLARLGADIVAVQEVASAADVTYIAQLAVDLGYAYVTVAPPGPFGALRAAILSDFPLTISGAWSSATLSGDPAANDLTRFILSARIALNDHGDTLDIIVNHWKSGASDTDEYRRSLESTRIAQVLLNPEAPAQTFVVMGDVNEDLQDLPLTPARFTVMADDLPATFVTGTDIQALLSTTGLTNNPFSPLMDWARLLDARQLDMDDATRPASGRRLDYLFASADLFPAGVQVFDCADEGLLSTLPLVGEPLDSSVCAMASDHLPVVADLIVPTSEAPDDCPSDGHLVLQNRTLSGTARYDCPSITLGPALVVSAGADLSLDAHQFIRLRPEVQLQAGSRVRLHLNPVAPR